MAELVHGKDGVPHGKLYDTPRIQQLELEVAVDCFIEFTLLILFLVSLQLKSYVS